MQLLQHSPRLLPQDAAEIAERLYGLRASAKSLPSERDQNFLLTDQSGAKFVLKVANALETGEFLEAQNQALAYLAARVAFCPRVIPTLTNSQMEATESATGEQHYLRLLTHLPGLPLAEVKGDAPHLWQDLGLKLGQLSLALADFDHPAAHRDFHWDLACVTQIIDDYGPLVTERAVRNFVDQCVANFEKIVRPLLPGLRRSVIHGDANNYNVLVSEAGLERQRVVGLIDFGDLVYSYTVAELAVAMAYAVLDKPHPLEIATLLFDGYCQHFALNEDEIAALWGLMLMRICMSVCHAAHQQQEQPDNQYLAISQNTIRNSLAGIMSTGWEQATERFLKKASTRRRGPQVRMERARHLSGAGSYSGAT